MQTRKSLILAALAGFAATAASADIIAGTAVGEMTIVDGPGADYAIVTEVPAASPLTIQGCSADGAWCKVESAGAVGWVRADSVNVTVDGAPVVLSQRPSTVTVRTIDNNQDEGAGAGLVAGAAAGAAIAGPVGAAVGAVVGAAGGAALAQPSERVVTYTTANPLPSVPYQGPIVVGEVVPDTIVLTPVPESEFAYAYVDGNPIVVETGTQRIVRVIE